MEHKGFGLGKFDKTGREIRCGDTVLHLNESPNTKKDYWYPLYRVVWDSPCFVAKWVGGGKASNVTFTLKNYPNELVIVNEQ